jgi:hypothetical protein
MGENYGDEGEGMRITSDWLLDSLHIWGTFLLTILVSFLSIEGGFWFGRRKRRQSSDEQEVLVRTMVGGAISLLAFVLAVTFWVAATHFDAARQSLLNNANAIRAAYLQADLLPQPYRTEIRNLLREYVDVRLEALRSGNIEQGISRSEELHSRLWSQAIAAREKTPNPVIDGYLTRSLNEVITMHARRVAMYKEFSIPVMVWIALYAITALAMASIGCHAGLTCENWPPVVPAFVLIFSVVMILIADLDQPRSGVFRLSERALVDVRNMMGATND